MTEDIIKPNDVTMAYLADMITGIVRKNGEKLLASNDSEIAVYFYHVLSVLFDKYEADPGETHDQILKAARENAEAFHILHEMEKKIKAAFKADPEFKKQVSDLVKSIENKESAIVEKKTTELPKAYGTAN